MGISVAICTFNRATLLSRALESLAAANSAAPDVAPEVLVIDNNSTDATRQVVEDFRKKLAVRYIFERQQGLSHARNRALQEFSGDWLVFTDDDVLLDANWLTAYRKCCSERASFDFVGGRVLPLWESPRPAWLVDENLGFFPGLLVKYSPDSKSRYLGGEDPQPFGASFAISRRLVRSVGSFRPDLGVTGNTPARGEEADYLARAVNAGYTGYYCNDALSWHPVDFARLTWRYMYRYGVQKGVALARMGGAEPVQAWWSTFDYALRGIWQLCKGRPDRARQCVINIGIQRGLQIAA